MTPLVLVHGFLGGGAQWAGQVKALDHTREVIALDLPGFGAHAHLTAMSSIDGYADWVIEEVRARGIGRYDLLGHSMGGMIVQAVARKDAARVRRLVLYSTGSVGVLPGRFETIEQSKSRARADGPTKTARRIAATWFQQETRAHGYAHCADIAQRAGLEAMLSGLDAMEAWSGTADLPGISAQTLVIWGDGDRTYKWTQTNVLWTGIAGARLAVVPGCAHAVHLEKPDVFNAILRDFLDT
ncbi:MAG: alpha/beta fold hydrolase [Pseudomonadota bacterium]